MSGLLPVETCQIVRFITLVATGCSSSVRFFGFAHICTMFVFLLI